MKFCDVGQSNFCNFGFQTLFVQNLENSTILAIILNSLIFFKIPENSRIVFGKAYFQRFVYVSCMFMYFDIFVHVFS